MNTKALFFFFKKISHYKKDFIICLLLNLTLSFSVIALLALSGWFISASAFAGLSLITASTFNYFVPAATIRLLACVRILARYFDRVINHDFMLKILCDLRVWFFSKIIPLSPAYLQNHRSSELLNQIQHDIDTLDHLYINIASPLLLTFIIFLSITFFIMYYSSFLALLFLVPFIFIFTMLPFFTYKIASHIGKEIHLAHQELRTKIIDFLQGFMDLFLFRKIKNTLPLFHEPSQKLAEAQRKLSHLKGSILAIMQLMSGVTIFLFLFFGIPLVNQQLLTGAQLAMLIFLLLGTFEQCLSFPLAFLYLGKTKEASHHLYSITLEEPSIVFLEKSTPIIKPECDLFLKNISFQYPDRSHFVIENFNLSIPTGMHIGITGPSGSGKSTLSFLLARIFDPTTGDIFLNQLNLKTYSEDILRKNINLMTQHVHIFNDTIRNNLTVMDNIFSDDQLWDVLNKVELDETIKALPENLDTLMGEFGKNFSGGQIRRFALARSLLKNSPILILDEPSAGLDKTVLEQIWNNCKMDFKNKTLIVMTHDHHLLSKMHTVIELSNNKILCTA